MRLKCGIGVSVFFLIFVLFFNSSLASAQDVILFKNGKVVTGKILSRDNESIVIDSGIGTGITYYSDEIVSVNQQPFVSEGQSTNESPEKVLDKFNTSLTTDDAAQYLTGFMKMMLASFYSKLSKEEQEKVMKSLRMKSYETKTIPVDNNLEFILVNNIVMADGSKPVDSQVAYEFDLKHGQWKIQNRVSTGSVMFGLFKQHFSPNQFNAQSSFEFDGTKVMMESAFAYMKKEKDNKKNLFIKFYTFPFQQRDIEFLKYGVGPQVKDTDKPTSVASSIFNYPDSVLDIYLNDNNQIISFSLNFFDFKGDKMSNDFAIQPADLNSYIQKFNITQNDFILISKGVYQVQPDKISWGININLPLIKKDIN